MVLTTADAITDLIASELRDAIEQRFGFSLPFTVEVRDKPDFDLIQAVDNTTIYVAAAPSVGLKREARGDVNQDIGIAIGVLKQLRRDATNGGLPDTNEFRELKSLMQGIYVWAHEGVEGYRGKVSNVQMPAWYDLSKAQSPGCFLSIVTMAYNTKFAA